MCLLSNKTMTLKLPSHTAVFTLLLTFTLLLILGVSQTLACSCLPFSSPQDQVQAYPFVYNGRIISKTQSSDGQRFIYRIRVMDTCKGGIRSGSIRIVDSNVSSAACGVDLQLYSNHIFFEDSSGGINLCGQISNFSWRQYKRACRGVTGRRSFTAGNI
mmetsp:Transcript_1325/g.4555  ORF Transcript_1325/g.4555 Transcript_1325/m.4555 type:complete len:159 (+) Transcript_1325:2059-2535(+)